MNPDTLNALCAARPAGALPWVLGVVLVLALAASWTMLWRNDRVYRYRTAIINAMPISTDHGVWMAWMAAYQSVDYDTMLWRFWRPLGSFYAGTILDSDGLLPR